jgi:hypothetical protein
MEGLDEFLEWIESQTFDMRRQVGRLSALTEVERQAAFKQVASVYPVQLQDVAMTYKDMRKQHKDPTVTELAERVKEIETAKMENAVEFYKKQLIKDVHKDTLVSKVDIETLYNSIVDVNTRLPTRESLGMAVRQAYYNSYPHLRVKPPRM